MTNTTSSKNARFHFVIEGILRTLVVLAVVTVAGFGIVERWRLASELPWQTDELPLLMRFTGATGQVTSEESAEEFQPTAYLLRTGVLRALQPPKDAAAVHTTANFWTNLSIYFGGVKPWVGRIFPFLFAVATMVVVAYATRAIGGGLTATGIAVGLVALSPMGIVYAAQARGYAEAMFLTPLLLLCVDALRKRPRDLVRAIVVLLVAAQLSFTVYTMWIFWVLPVVLVAVVWMPQGIVDRESARQVRYTLSLTAIALIGIVGIYTLDRWSALTFTAGNMGEQLGGLAAALDFAAKVARALTPMEELVAIPAFLGLVILLRTHCRWWGLAIICSLLVPLALASILGTAGFARNFAYMLCPLAMLSGLGLERFLIALLERRHRVLVHATAAVLLLAGMLAAWDGAARDARSMILPNWGGVIQMLSQRPLSVGPRWISPCLTHHWPINWYQGPEAVRQVARFDAQQPIEIIVGTTLNPQGAEIVYREDVVQHAVVEMPAPAFITSNNSIEKMHGVHVRRWLAQPVAVGTDELRRGTTGFFWIEDGAAAERWSSLLNQWPVETPLLNFKPAALDGRLLRQALVDARDVRLFETAFQQAYAGYDLPLWQYDLTPMTGHEAIQARSNPNLHRENSDASSVPVGQRSPQSRSCGFEWDQQF